MVFDPLQGASAMKGQFAQIGALSFLALTACTTMGSGSGSSLTGDVRAALAWKGTNTTGNMTATLSTGKSYAGMYLQVKMETRVDDLGPLAVGWGRRWRGWPAWDLNPGPEFITEYSGRVVANLAATDGSHMRCRFRLAEPSAGMAGGGQGECQLPGGEMIDTTFPPT
jgi:hypothetical protein